MSDEVSPQQAESDLQQLASHASNVPPGQVATSLFKQGGPDASALRAEARYRVLVEQIPAITFMAALDEGINELYVSPQIEQMLGYTQKEWLEDPILWYARLHPDDRDRWHMEFSRCCATGERFCSEYRFLARDGHVVWVHGEAQMVRDDAGRPLFLQGIAFDITVQKQAEEALQRSRQELEELVELRTGELKKAVQSLTEEIAERKRVEAELFHAKLDAEAANRLKGAFLANMSHEIRTPMNGILGLAELALQASPAPEQVRYMNEIMRSGEHLLRVINDILDFSKIEAGKLDFESIDFSLRDTLDDSIRLLAPQARQKGIALYCVVADEVPNGLVGDPGRLRQVLVNLIGNAVKFTSRGEIAVSAGIRNLPAAEDEIELEFAVRDTGIGISDAQRQSIFQPFVQADGSTMRKHGGTGLGLTISARLVEGMGGRLGVESAVGQGSVFHFTARFGRSQTSAASLEPQLAPPGVSGLQVLLVDDNAVNQLVASEMLKGLGHEVVLAGNGAEALATLASQPFDLVFMDVQMPEMDGFETTAVLRAREQQSGGHIPVIAMTAHVMKGDRERCLSAGMDDYLSKPINRLDVQRVIARTYAAATIPAVGVGPLAHLPDSNWSGLQPEWASLPLSSVFDRQSLLARLGGDEGLLGEVVRLFLADSARMLGEVRESLVRGDVRGAEKAAHSLKGTAGSLSAPQAAAAAADIEAHARQGDLAGASDRINDLVQKVDCLNSVLAHELGALGGRDQDAPAETKAR